MRIVIAIFLTCICSYGQLRNVSYDNSTRNVQQTDLDIIAMSMNAATLQVNSVNVVSVARSLTMTGTANEITLSAGAQDLSANRTWTFSLPVALTFTGKTITGGSFTSITLTTPIVLGAIAFPDDVRQTFNPGTTVPGINVGSLAGNPSTLSNGDLWYNSSSAALMARINGSSIALGSGGSGSAPIGTMVNVGNNIVGGIPVAVDTTDTNYVPSLVTIEAQTNVLAGQLHGTNQVSGGRFIGTGVTADSRVDVPDDDGSAYAGFQANNTTTTPVNLVFPAAPFLGLANWAVTSTSNWVPSQLAGTSGGVIYFSAANTPATSAALAANALVVGGGAGAAPATVTTGSGVLTALAAAVNGAAGVLTTDGTASPTGKTYDAGATGNVLLQLKQLNLQRPDYGDGIGAVPQTNAFNVSGLMHYTLSGNAETNANFVVYEFDCPSDLNTAVELTARFAFLSGGTDADDYVFHLTYAQVAPGTAYPTGTGIATSPIVMTVTPTTAANGDFQASSAVTLTGWAAALTPGRAMVLRLARLQNAQDDGARDVQLVITYGSTL